MRRRSQTLVEYMLGISVIVIGVALGFTYLADSTRDSFKNARENIQEPYP